MELQMFSTILAVALFVHVASSADECSTAGVQCSSDCKDIVLCPSVGSKPIVTVNCHTEETPNFCYRNATTESCDCSGKTCPNGPHPFTCTDIGSYPSAFDCNKMYVCTDVGVNATRECVCGEGEYYDLATGACKTGTCPRVPADCSTTGTTEELEEGSGYCYTCSQGGNALVFRCSKNGKDVFRNWDLDPSTKGFTCGNVNITDSMWF